MNTKVSETEYDYTNTQVDLTVTFISCRVRGRCIIFKFFYFMWVYASIQLDCV